jgi:hypothetical protein
VSHILLSTLNFYAYIVLTEYQIFNLQYLYYYLWQYTAVPGFKNDGTFTTSTWYRSVCAILQKYSIQYFWYKILSCCTGKPYRKFQTKFMSIVLLVHCTRFFKWYNRSLNFLKKLRYLYTSPRICLMIAVFLPSKYDISTFDMYYRQKYYLYCIWR